MSPPQELDRGAPGCLNILVEYITKMSRHPGVPFPSCLGAFGLIFGPLAPLQDHKEIQTYGKNLWIPKIPSSLRYSPILLSR